MDWVSGVSLWSLARSISMVHTVERTKSIGSGDWKGYGTWYANKAHDNEFVEFGCGQNAYEEHGCVPKAEHKGWQSS